MPLKLIHKNRIPGQEWYFMAENLPDICKAFGSVPDTKTFKSPNIKKVLRTAMCFEIHIY